MSKVLVTGVNGFVGKHLARELDNRGYEVIGTGLNESPHPQIAEVLSEYVACDLTETNQVDKLPIESYDAIISLAGLARVSESFSNAENYMRVNRLVFSVLAERMLKSSSIARLVSVSTGAVYSPNQPLPLSESSLTINEGSPYALSKLAMEESTLEYRAKGLDCVIARPFNHTGPGQEPGFLIPDLHAKIMLAKQTDGVVRTGNLQSARDYTDVRDVAKAYADLATRDRLEFDTYNVCSGITAPGSLILELMLASCGISKNELDLKLDNNLVRPNDPATLYGSYERLHNATGWRPKIELGKTIQDFVEQASSSLPRSPNRSVPSS